MKYKSTFTYFNNTDTTSRYQSRLNKIDRKDEYIVDDLFDESSTIYQLKCMKNKKQKEYKAFLKMIRIIRGTIHE